MRSVIDGMKKKVMECNYSGGWDYDLLITNIIVLQDIASFNQESLFSVFIRFLNLTIFGYIEKKSINVSI